MSPRRPSPERVSFYRRLPLWFQWGFPFAIAIGVVALVIIFVANHQGQNGSEASVSTSAAKAEYKIGAAAMRQQQAPHTAKLAAGATASSALEHAIRTWVDGQTKIGALNGPVKDASCAELPALSTSARIAVKCTIKAADVTYDFRGVAQPKLAKATFCQKIEYPPSYGEPTYPLSPVCT